MSNPHDHPTALADLQDSIYREKVHRARTMTREERISTIFEISKSHFGMMHAGAMARLGTQDEDLGWKEVRQRLTRLDHTRDYGFYVRIKPAA